MRRHDSAQLLLLISLGGMNILLTLGCSIARLLDHDMVSSLGFALVVLPWSIWLVSMRTWLRGLEKR